ncbi:MAG: S46 family peptidase [Acidobacteria bacterium]|nr:S46 family peptidase [Acidobacteriota bacterium]
MKARPFLFVLCLACLPAWAEEGMWLPEQVPALAPQLRAIGFDGDPAIFADLLGHPMGAIVSLGGCSASFVSPDGLIATNHHCVVGALQYNSVPGRNLLEDGYLAGSRGEELWNGPTSRVYVTVAASDVTADLERRLTGNLDDLARHEAIERWTKERIAACEKDGLRCRVEPFFGGARYIELAQLEIRDVRLVYAPSKGIGEFGGEADNWRWPRHTGDFSFVRAYVGPDGKPADNAPANVPYHPKHWLKVAAAGASPNEVVFVAGYPGRTERLLGAPEIRHMVEWSLPRAIRRTTEQLALLDRFAGAGEATAIKIATFRRWRNNSLTNNKGTLEGLLRQGEVAQREARERELSAWIAADPERRARYGDPVAELAAIHAEANRHADRDAALDGVLDGSTLLAAADVAYRFSLELPKPDLEREREFQEREWTRIRERQQRVQKMYDPAVDRALLRYNLLEAAALPAAERIAELDRTAGLRAGMTPDEAAHAIDALLDKLYAGTKLGDVAFRTALIGKPTAEVLAAKDPFVELAVALHPALKAKRQGEKKTKGALSRVRPRYMRALMEKEARPIAPDANGTLRVTYGRVVGVEIRDALVYAPQTTLAGIVAKHTGEGEFNAPRRQLEAIERLRAGKPSPFVDPRLGDVPVDFLSTVDTTGGNSGSATLNGRGELVGLLFDGLFETVASDVSYEAGKTRSIHVDIRYGLWTMAEVDGARALLAELGLKP